MWSDRVEKGTLGERVRDYIFRHEARIFAALLFLPPVLIFSINLLQNITYYDSLMMGIAGYQAIITAYLSLKIYSVSMRDSFLPSISFSLTDVTETPTPWDDHTCVTCEYTITNHSHGRAKIRELDVTQYQILPDQNPPPDKDVSVGFPQPGEWPVTLDKGEKATITVQINGLGYYDAITIGLNEVSMGQMEYQLMLSDISNYLMMKKHG